VGFVFAFLSALLTIRFLLRFVASNSFIPFAWYRIVFGVLILISAATGWVVWVE
jgi:undecaprenyl-diphosphatase